MHTSKLSWALGLALALSNTAATSGVLDPDCTAEKAAKSTAMKATVGVGGRCSPKEAAADMTKDAVGIEDKGPIEKRRDDDGVAKKATKKIRD
ncbi:MAG: hypothetical protein U9P11_07020 [Pseudomonadota bacterium]|nr:hypothetical protein [Pseudomonadota bacterium]